MKRCRRILGILIVVLGAASAVAAEDADDAKPAASSQAPSYAEVLNIVAASTLEARITLNEKFTIPMLTGEGLLAGNNLLLKIAPDVSPVTANLGFEATLTPIAFLQFTAGAQISTGWPFLDLGTGIGLVGENADGTFTVTQTALQYLSYKFKFGGVFQFDLAALVPGDWNHVVVRTSHELWYRAIAGLADSASWKFENSDGMDRNGWNYYGNYFAGYQMPIFLQTVGVLLETDYRLYAPPTARPDTWGETMARLNFGPLVNFKIDEHLSIAALVQFKTIRNYTAATKDLFYQNRILDAANPQSLVWNRFALSVDITF